MNGLPKRVDVEGAPLAGRRFELRRQVGPHVDERLHERDVGLHLGVAQDGRQAGLVGDPFGEEAPQRVAFVVERTVTHPARERRLGGRVVVAVEYGVRHARQVAQVTRDLDAFERLVEDEARVGDLLAADDVLAREMRARSDELVDHLVAVSRHLVVGEDLAVLLVVPRLAFGNVDVHERLDGHTALAVGLDARLDAAGAAPCVQFVEETLLEELGQRQFVVVAHAVDALHHVGFDPGAVGRLDLVAVGAYLFQDQRVVGVEVVSAPFLELFADVLAPVGAFQLEAVGEERADAVVEVADDGAHGIGHPVEVTAHGLGVEVVEHRPAGTQRTVDHAHVAGVLDHDVGDVAAGRNVDRHLLRFRREGHGRAGDEFGDVGGEEPHLDQFGEFVAIGREQFGRGASDEIVGTDGHLAGAFELHRTEGHHLDLLVAREGLGAEWPARADDQVTVHAARGGFAHGEVDQFQPAVR